MAGEFPAPDALTALHREAAALVDISREIGKLAVYVEELLPLVAFRLRVLAFNTANLATLITAALRQYEDAHRYEPPWWSERYNEWIEDALNIREPSY